MWNCSLYNLERKKSLQNHSYEMMPCLFKNYPTYSYLSIGKKLIKRHTRTLRYFSSFILLFTLLIFCNDYIYIPFIRKIYFILKNVLTRSKMSHSNAHTRSPGTAAWWPLIPNTALVCKSNRCQKNGSFFVLGRTLGGSNLGDLTRPLSRLISLSIKENTYDWV